MPPKKLTEKPTINIGSMEIVVGNTYEVIGKKDFDAPDGFRQHETTKYLIPGIKEVRSIYFDESTQRWDTGFEEYSPSNSKIPRDQRKVIVDTYVKHVKEPYEKWSRKSIEATNDDFWGGNDSLKQKPFMYEIYTGKTFDTKKPNELLELFLALKQGAVCKKGEKDPLLSRTAKYCIRDREKAVSLNEERANNKAQATFTFMTLLNALDPKNPTDDTLYTILEWLQFSTVRGADKDALLSTVTKRFEDPKTGYETTQRFLEAYEMTKNEDTREKMELFSIASKLRDRQVFEYKRAQYYLNGEIVGNSLKGIAEKAAIDPDLKKQLIDEYEKVS